jgi:alpha-beta hydrolase superfamily lysophospholipase
MVHRPVATTGQWIGSPERPLMSWLTEPVEGGGELGVLIVPPVGYEYSSAHRTLRTLAEGFAQQGCRALRFDFDGTGDSAGDQWDPGRLETWRADVVQAAAALRGWGVSRITVVGLRIGGTLALLQGDEVGADAVVAWAPVVRGRRYVSELQLLGLSVPDSPTSPEQSGGVVQAGAVFSAETLAALGKINLADLPTRPASRVLVVDRHDKPPSAALLDRLSALGVEPDHIVSEGNERFLDRPTEYGVVPHDIVDEICRWVGPSALAEPMPVVPSLRTSATIAWQSRPVVEEVVELGAGGLVGILTRPAAASRATVLWLNSGSEHHVGPGRAWVEYARELAFSDVTSFRMDFSGWGESPDRGHAPGRPYDPHGISETAEAVRALRERGHARVILAGLCAGAWIGLQAALTVDVDGVIALNPQLYWKPGDPVEVDLESETRPRRMGQIRRNKRLRALGVWSALDALGSRPRVAKWLGQLADRRIPIFAVFAEGDDGLEYLEDRNGRAWRRTLRGSPVEYATVAGIDHPMHRHWHRATMAQTLAGWLTATFPLDQASSQEQARAQM